MNLAGIKAHFSNWREWELNPIVVKELRQAVRSWAVTGMLLLFLTGLFIISLLFLIFQSFDVGPDMELGGEMFSWFTGILAVASVIFIPLYMGIRVAAERQENNPDLFYVSTLSPTRIILGKFLCGAYMALLFFSACMPFMAFSNILRGVDLPTIFYILFHLFLIVCAVNMIAIFLACIPASRPFKVFFTFCGFVASFWLVFPVIALSLQVLRAGVGTTMGSGNFWAETLTQIALGAAVTGLFYVMAVALVSPLSSNRALPVRIYISVIWLLTGLLCLGWVRKAGHAEIVYAWFIPMFILLLASLVVVISNSDVLSHRVRRAIPKSRLMQYPAFLFFNGAAGGLLWVGLMMAATFLAVDLLFPTIGNTSNTSLSLKALAAYAFDYALTGLFIHRTFFPHRPAKLTGLIAALVAAACCLMPSIVLFFLNELTWNSIEGLELGNAFNIYSMRDDSRIINHVYFSLGWFALMVLLNAPWFGRQVRNFVQPPAVTPPVIAYGPGNPTSPAGR
ncbi:MAG TPA: hypothetical protein VMF08_23515 [Candidatus Sulfotelmatobacter sp.]|nr:hypothetical protein [Candidatus Sulfotelmatobacter sp.]